LTASSGCATKGGASIIAASSKKIARLKAVGTAEPSEGCFSGNLDWMARKMGRCLPDENIVAKK
jgi:hypothetical protein